MAKITFEEYQDLKAKGLADKEIAVMKGMAPSYLSLVKKQFKGAPQPNTAEKKPSDTNTTPKEKDAKSADYESQIKSLQEKVKELESLHAACDDVENEVASLREEKNQLQEDYNKLVTKQYHLDYTVENQKKQIEDLGKTLERYERENRAMRELLRQWI